MRIATLERKNFWTLVLLAVAAVGLLVFALSVQPADASEGTFDLTVKHGINGTSLGTAKDLPVDVYVNNGYLFTFSFKESKFYTLAPGDYFIEVKLAGTDTVVMSLDAQDIPAGVDVNIRAKLSAQKTPTLKVKVK